MIGVSNALISLYIHSSIRLSTQDYYIYNPLKFKNIWRLLLVQLVHRPTLWWYSYSYSNLLNFLFSQKLIKSLPGSKQEIWRLDSLTKMFYIAARVSPFPQSFSVTGIHNSRDIKYFLYHGCHVSWLPGAGKHYIAAAAWCRTR